MGESMAKDYLKKGLDKVPDSNRDDVQELRKRAKDGLPSGLGDTLGKLVSYYDLVRFEV